MAFAKDSGYQGQIRSLAGVLGKLGMGLTIEQNYRAVATGVITRLINPNPLRKWAVIVNPITNSGNTDILFSSGSGWKLAPGGFLIINEDLPWTGEVNAYQTEVATQNIAFTEAVISQ